MAEDSDFVTAKKQLEAVRRSGKTNMFALGNVKQVAVQCDLHELVVELGRLQERRDEASLYLDTLSEATDEFAQSDDPEIEEFVNRIRNTRITVEI